MRNRAQQIVLRRLVTRVRTGISFVQNHLDGHPTPDAAWIRNLYILLSFYTELLLKAIYVNEMKYRNRSELSKIFMSQSHKLDKIASEIGKDTLMKYGILDVKKVRKYEYRVKTSVGVYLVKDFVDIRYDFMSPRIRKLQGDEYEMFETQILSIRNAASLLTGPAWS